MGSWGFPNGKEKMGGVSREMTCGCQSKEEGGNCVRPLPKTLGYIWQERFLGKALNDRKSTLRTYSHKPLVAENRRKKAWLPYVYGEQRVSMVQRGGWKIGRGREEIAIT